MKVVKAREEEVWLLVSRDSWVEEAVSDVSEGSERTVDETLGCKVTIDDHERGVMRAPEGDGRTQMRLLRKSTRN